MNEQCLITTLKADYRYYKHELKWLKRKDADISLIYACTVKLEYITELLVTTLSDAELKDFDKTLYEKFSVNDL